MGLFRQEHWSRLPFPPPGDFPNPGVEPVSPVSPALQADYLPAEPGEAIIKGCQSSPTSYIIGLYSQ